MVARQARVTFTWVKAHSGILLNECADQLARRSVGGSSYCSPVEIPNEVESRQEFEMADEDVTQWDDWSELEQRPPMATPPMRVGLVADGQREHQEELQQ
jgi:hypothetical protein